MTIWIVWGIVLAMVAWMGYNYLRIRRATKIVDNAEFDYPDNQVEEADFVALNVSDEQFENFKQTIQNKETTLQELCDNGYEFSKEQFQILEAIENAAPVSNES